MNTSSVPDGDLQKGIFKTLPNANLMALWNLGVAGVPVTQYLRWADDVDLIITMANKNTVTKEEILLSTSLSDRGIDAMLGILCSLHLAEREGGSYKLGVTAREYLDRRRPCYVGKSLYGMLNGRIPPGIRKSEKPRHYFRTGSSFLQWLRRVGRRKSMKEKGSPQRLEEQHSRNFPAGVAAANSVHFAGIKHLLDIGGGSGACSIPLAIGRPDLKIALVELPSALLNVETFLERYSVKGRISLVGLNVFNTPWPFKDCDGVLFGNFLHCCSDDECVVLLNETYRILPKGGKIFLHEMLWNDNKDGPLVTALWNFWLTSVSTGGQRTRAEFVQLLQRAGFSEPAVEETCGGFSLLVSTKPIAM